MKSPAALPLVIIIVLSCSKPPDTGDSGMDTVATEMDTTELTSDMEEASPDEDEDEDKPHIYYTWNGGYSQERMFAPFETVYNRCQQLIRFRDSLYFKHEYELTSADSALIAPEVAKAYEKILEYGDLLKSTVTIPKGNLPDRSGISGGGDSHLLETRSHTLDKIEFAFIGGAPFVEQPSDLYKDQSGNPETRYVVQIPENSMFFFNYVYASNTGPMELSYGPPLSTYEGIGADINGIGSITHELRNRIPVWFFTTSGAVPATLVSVNMKLGDDYGCVSDNHTYVFACSKDISPDEIFGVFYSESKLSMTKAVSNREAAPYVWEFDIDGDGNADLARIDSTTSGGSSDELAVAIWYARVNDNWVVIDYATQPDCT